MSFDEVGKGFAGSYYASFGTDRSQCAGIYRPSSLMTYGGEQIAGVDAIMEKFANLGFQTAHFIPSEIDCHPTNGGAGVLVVVNGEVKVDEEEHSLAYNDVFNLAVDEAGQWFVANQFSRILGGGSV